MEVTVCPDYVLYGDRLTTCSRLTFTSDGIKFEDLNVFGRDESFSIKWDIDDIIRIGSQWSQTVGFHLYPVKIPFYFLALYGCTN